MGERLIKNFKDSKIIRQAHRFQRITGKVRYYADHRQQNSALKRINRVLFYVLEEQIQTKIIFQNASTSGFKEAVQICSFSLGMT